MLIDWFTIVAQLINFVILLVALKFLLFDRIVEAMNERSDRIEARRREAEEKRSEAEKEAERLQRERREFESEREGLLDEARREAESRRHELIEEARSDVDEQEQQWLEALRRKQDRLARHLQRQAGAQVVEATRRVLADLADADLEDAVVAGFVRSIERLDVEERQSVADSLASADGAALIRTGFELSESRRESVREALRRLTGDEGPEFEWERDSEITAGIQVETEVARVGWTIDGYLDELLEDFERSVRATIASSESDEGVEADRAEQDTDDEPEAEHREEEHSTEEVGSP